MCCLHAERLRVRGVLSDEVVSGAAIASDDGDGGDGGPSTSDVTVTDSSPGGGSSAGAAAGDSGSVDAVRVRSRRDNHFTVSYMYNGELRTIDKRTYCAMRNNLGKLSSDKETRILTAASSTLPAYPVVLHAVPSSYLRFSEATYPL